MEPNIPWYKSAILRQQIVQLLIAGGALFGVSSPDIDWDATIGALFAGAAAATALWTVITRLFKPAPNLTAKAAEKEQELVAKGVLPHQGGFARVGLLIAMALTATACITFVQGCTGTRAAYGEAKGSLGDTAYVVAEHYAALVKEAADLAQSPTTPVSAKDAMKRADRAVKRFIVGDPATDLPSLQTLVSRWQAVKDAETEADLQASINAAIRELSNFSKAVKTARSLT